MFASRLFIVSLLLSCMTKVNPLKEHGALRGSKTDEALDDASRNVSMNLTEESERGLYHCYYLPCRPQLIYPMSVTLSPQPPPPQPPLPPPQQPSVSIIRPKNGKVVNLHTTFTVKVHAYDMYGDIQDSYVWWYADGNKFVASGKLAKISTSALGAGTHYLRVQAYSPGTGLTGYSDYVSVTVVGPAGSSAQGGSQGYQQGAGQAMGPNDGQVVQSVTRHRGGNRDGDIFSGANP